MGRGIDEGMGKSSLYNILVNDKNDEDKSARRTTGDDFRTFPGFSSFHWLTKRIRRSFRKLGGGPRRSGGGGLGGGKQPNFLSTKDTGFETEARLDKSDCCSVDSGLDSDASFLLDSSTLQPTTTTASLQTSRDKDESLGSVEIIRKSSNRSSRTIDSGIASRNSNVGCLVTSRLQHVPKKKVSILLPGERSKKGGFFGHDFRVEKTRIYKTSEVAGTQATSENTIRAQRQRLLTTAMHELILVQPDLCDTIHLIFQPKPNLRSLDTEEVSSLLFNIRSLIFRALPQVQHFEISLFILQIFLLKVSRLLQTIPNLKSFPQEFELLMAKSEKYAYSKQSFILKETQFLYIDLWCSLLQSTDV